MYLSIGGDMAVRDRAVIGVFDLDNTSYSRHTRAFLAEAERQGEVVDVSAPLETDFGAVLDVLGWRPAYDEKAGRPWEALPADIETLS